MTAWNNYTQALLHYKPQMFYELFMYQKNFCMLAAKYKFEACYMYDKDFRLLIASQSSLHPGQRSAKWDLIQSDLHNMHLQQDMLLPSCYHCRVTGHYVTNCPVKVAYNKTLYSPSHNNDSTFRNDTFRNASNTAHNFQPPSHQNTSFSNVDPPRPTSNNNKQQAQFIRSCNRFNRGNYCAKPPCQYMQ